MITINLEPNVFSLVQMEHGQIQKPMNVKIVLPCVILVKVVQMISAVHLVPTDFFIKIINVKIHVTMEPMETMITGIVTHAKKHVQLVLMITNVLLVQMAHSIMITNVEIVPMVIMETNLTTLVKNVFSLVILASVKVFSIVHLVLIPIIFIGECV
jgi:hypothetical protein